MSEARQPRNFAQGEGIYEASFPGAIRFFAMPPPFVQHLSAPDVSFHPRPPPPRTLHKRIYETQKKKLNAERKHEKKTEHGVEKNEDKERACPDTPKYLF